MGLLGAVERKRSKGRSAGETRSGFMPERVSGVDALVGSLLADTTGDKTDCEDVLDARKVSRRLCIIGDVDPKSKMTRLR